MLGAPGVGKGTQAELLCANLGACHLSTGDIFRAAKALDPGERTPALTAALDYMRRGDLVPDETVLALVAERVGCLRCEGGFLLDGFPRTVAQAEALEKLLAGEHLALDAVLSYELPLEQVVSRLSGRRTCPNCKASGPSNVSASVKAYFGLKMAGFTADHPALARARKKILEMGGVTEVNTFTKIYLCFFGQYDYDAVPAVPPEIVLFPNWFWFNIYEISSWSRAILVPLSICYAKKPFKKIPDEMGVEELFVGGRDKSRMHLHWAKKLISWRNFFLLFDRMTHWAERVHIRPLRSLALKHAEKWMLERFEMSDGLGAIYPSMMNAIIALRCLGYSVDDPQFIRALDEFEKLGIEEGDTFRMQPCMSPVWDTAYALFALGEAGVPATDPRLVKCADWILQKQVRKPGDWKIKNPKGEPGGWYFEFNNEFYPDVDDTAMVCLGLSRVEHPNGRYQAESVQRAIDWILSMQCKNGGWASFDKDNDRMVFQYVPFADHNAMLDPATVDITGRILECLASYGYDQNHTAVQRGIKFIRNTLGERLQFAEGAGARKIFHAAIGRGDRCSAGDMLQAGADAGGDLLRRSLSPARPD